MWDYCTDSESESESDDLVILYDSDSDIDSDGVDSDDLEKVISEGILELETRIN